jgi:Ferredoxin-dependent bilin reductase
MRDEVLRQLRVFEELIRARMQVDVAGMLAGVRARLESRLSLEPLPVDADLADKRGPFGWGRVRTWAWQAPGFRKIVLSHIAMPPVIEGFALTAMPSARRAAPLFAADLMALPTRVSVNADLYAVPPLQETARRALEPLGEGFSRLDSGGGPNWAHELGSGRGLHAKLSPRAVDDAFAALNAALARSLELIAAAPDGDPAPLPAADDGQRRFFEAFHAHGPRKGPLGRLMGAAWAERYSRLIFE